MKDFKIHCSQIHKIMGNGKGGELPVTCQTFLKEWYANDREEIHSKYLDKGNYVEEDNIDFAASVLGLGILEKNHETRSDEYFIGSCDVITDDLIIDVKSPWNRKTLLDNIYGIDKAYEYQGRGYMRLYNKSRFILFYGLQNTPAEINYGNEITFDDLDDSDRWIAYEISRNEAIEEEIIERVKLCRDWLLRYDEAVKLNVGKLIKL